MTDQTPGPAETRRIVIMGCGRLGSTLAAELDEEGALVTMIDVDAAAFNWLPDAFSGSLIVGPGEDVDVQARAGVGDADVFLALANGDNRNAMAAQVAKHILGAKRVVARIFDPERAEMYRELGIRVVNPTTVLDDLVRKAAFGQ